MPWGGVPIPGPARGGTGALMSTCYVPGTLLNALGVSSLLTRTTARGCHHEPHFTPGVSRLLEKELAQVLSYRAGLCLLTLL